MPNKILDQINADFEQLANNYALGNAHGIPISKEVGTLTLLSLEDLKFKQKIPVTNPMLPTILRDIASILEQYF